MSERADAIVVGAGLHGCSAALHLARRGKQVIVLERRYAGRHSSGINAGGVRTLGRDPAEIALSIAGMELWHNIRDLVDDDCGFTMCGQIKVAESPAEMAKLEARAAATRALGFDHEELIDRDELFRLLPALAPHCVGGLAVRTDGAADPYRTTLAFKRKAEALGVRIIEDEGVVGLERKGESWEVVGERGRYSAPAVVNCTGAWAARFAAMIGDQVPLSIRASMMIVTERMPPFVKPVVGAVGRKLSFKQTAAGTVVIGGGQQGRADLDTEHGEVVFGNLSRSAEAATALFPVMNGARIVRTWCGVEAQTPDDIPVIGRSPNAPGVVHSFGYSGHGFQLGPIVGSAIADLVTEGATNLPIAPFAIERFARQQEAA
jgi:sarcosine oxidase, subunit beta